MHGSSWRLRPARQSDLDRIAAIWHRGASLPGVGPSALPSEAELRGRIDTELAAGWDITVADSGHDIDGFAAMRPAAGTLDQLFLDPDILGQGVGRALLDHCKRAMPRGFSLFTRPGNARACRFYEANGFARLRDERHPQFGDVITVFHWGPQDR